MKDFLGRLRGDGWVSVAKFAGTAVVAAVALAVSAVQLVKLAGQVHIDDALRWTLPVTLDVGGVVATVVWAKGGGSAQKWGKGIAIMLLLESVVGNVISHLLDAGIIQMTGKRGTLLIICVSAIYPLNLSAMVHLIVSSSDRVKKAVPKHAKQPEPRRTEAIRESVKPAVKPEPAPTALERKPIETAKPKNLVELTTAGSKREQGRAWFMEQVFVHDRNPDEITASEVDAQIETNAYAKKHIQAWRAEAFAAIKATPTAVAGN
ncbi:DUF2637 domain-containing protein [Kutzneria albida]|uniref:Uncharacterized protein n=1 Tax=Kutzneria albida DSM 43870 TaxID=1449976 RepID=W5WC09_9PSEU|nr:DUF2637 domain-containing protein [Kutzneria albida]AHH98290.1 hypothetical protein KALB_4928 [Kutzneria albida DSM 43870]